MTMKSSSKLMLVFAVVWLSGCINGGSTSMNYNSGHSNANSGKYSSLMNMTKKTTVELSCSDSHYSTFKVTFYTDGTATVSGVYNVGTLVGKSFSTDDAHYEYHSGSYHDVYKRWILVSYRARGKYYETVSITEDGVVIWYEIHDYDIPKLLELSRNNRVINVY